MTLTDTAAIATDNDRAATLLLAWLDDDADTVVGVLGEAHLDDGGLQGMILALAGGFIELLIGTLGVDRVHARP